MNYFIKNIKINKLLHLQDFNIPIQDEECPNLIITGKNGSGKTILLNAIADLLEQITSTNAAAVLDIRHRKGSRVLSQEEAAMVKAKQFGEWVQIHEPFLYSKVELEIDNPITVIEQYQKGEFIIAFYQADRNSSSDMIEPKSPTKPQYNKRTVRGMATAQFLNFLSDLKIQEALARNENKITYAEEIHKWFAGFEGLLQEIYQDDKLELEFNYKDYSFKINTEGKSFKFTQMSDGFAAILDIVADLILKTQSSNSLTRAYQKQGIVLIDEIETHLHLALQKIIMPFLTKIFPNIQFIVTTHSPFVLSSMNNAIAFDLEHKEVINELTEYSYEALAEGYFGVNTAASYMEMQLNTLQKTLSKQEMTDSDNNTVKQIMRDFAKIPEVVSPLLVGRYRQIRIQYADKIREL